MQQGSGNSNRNNNNNNQKAALTFSLPRDWHASVLSFCMLLWFSVSSCVLLIPRGRPQCVPADDF